MEIELFGQLSRQGEMLMHLKVKEPLAVGEIIKQLNLDEELIGLVMIDGKPGKLSDLVNDDARICFFPYLSGG